MLTTRVALVLACASALLGAACGHTTTTPSQTPADATVSETFSSTVTVGGGIFYSFSMAQYGNVAVTLTSATGTDVPDGLTLGISIGTPSGTSCTVSSSVTAAPGDTAQLTGVYGPGVFCVRIYDAGTLTAPVTVAASVAHS